jgi:hypothetical protein
MIAEEEDGRPKEGNVEGPVMHGIPLKWIRKIALDFDTLNLGEHPVVDGRC